MGVRAGTWLLALTAVLAACSSEEPPAALPELSSPGSSAVAPTANTQVPSAAQPNSATAASAFTRFFFDSVNTAYATGDVAVVRTLSDGDCQTCSNIISDIARLAASRHSVTGQRFRLGPTAAAPANAAGRVVVDVRYASDRYLEVDRQGGVVRDNAAKTGRDLQVALSRAGETWVVDGIRES